MADRLGWIAASEEGLWSDPILISGISQAVHPHDGRYFSEKMEAIDAWLYAPEQVGQFTSVLIGYFQMAFRFTDPRTAFAFKMKFG